MTLDELFAQTRPLALRIAELRRDARLLTVDVFRLIDEHRATCEASRQRGEVPVEAHVNWITALSAWAAVEIGDAEPAAAALQAASALGLRDLCDSERSQALTPARCLELMLSQRFEHQIGGN